MGVRRFTSAAWWTRSGAVRGSAAAIGAGLLLAPLAGLSGCNGNSAPASAGGTSGTAVTADGQSAGVAIATVTPGSPAASAGLRAGDVIVTVNGEQITSQAELTDVLAAKRPGQQVPVTFVRAGARHTVTVKFGTLSS